MQLPIDIVPNSQPRAFKWRQTISNIGGDGYKVIECNGSLPVSVERAVEDLIHLTKKLLKENEYLHGKVDGLKEQVNNAQSELPSKKAEAQKTKK